MPSPIRPSRARLVLSLMVLLGIGLLTIPLFLTPPAFLELSLRDAVFGADLRAQPLTVTDDSTGIRMNAALRRAGDRFRARIGRINSGPGAYTVRVHGYAPGIARVNAAPMQTVNAAVELTPTFGRLQVTPVDATRVGEHVAATVKAGSRTLTSTATHTIAVDLPPGTHRLTADANGFCPAERQFEVRAGKVTAAVFPLSPDLRSSEVARFVLGWQREPRDLDSHFKRAGTRGFPNPTHVFFLHRRGTAGNGAILANLDVDMLHPGGYETVTVHDAGEGEFEYYVHLFAGTGTIGGAGAAVHVYTRGCQVRTFEPPPDCNQRIWSVANLRHRAGNVDLSPQQRCGPMFDMLRVGDKEMPD